MHKNMPKLGTVMMVAVIIAWVGVWVTPAFAKKALVEVTGQTECFDPSGNSENAIPCDDTGQDGDIQAGVPCPTPRFTARQGAVNDNLTGFIWLKNANCFGNRAWAQALTDANTLAHGSCGLTDGSVAGDWRLPNVKELQSLLDFGRAQPPLPAGHPFLNVQAAIYWSSTSLTGITGGAWGVAMLTGGTDIGGKDGGQIVWPVRGGLE
jgi:Protein of unknown function (DUF1566)